MSLSSPIAGTCVVLALSVSFLGAASVPTFEPLNAFTMRTRSSNPELVQDATGNVYGTSSYDGSSGLGTVFKINTSGVLTTLVNFNGANGSNPSAGLIWGADGNLYGTTSGGGNPGTYGTIFRVTPAGQLTSLFSFGGSNGRSPASPLLLGSDGNFYGTTQFGGEYDTGTVFRMTPAGQVTSLARLESGFGRLPSGNLVEGGDGQLYGTSVTPEGPHVFSLAKDGTNHRTITVNFGMPLIAGLGRDGAGNVYGSVPVLAEGQETVKGHIFKIASGTATVTDLPITLANGGALPAGHFQTAGDGSLQGVDYSGKIFKMTPAGSFSTLAQLSLSGDTVIGGLADGPGTAYSVLSRSSNYSNLSVLRALSTGATIYQTPLRSPGGYYPGHPLVQDAAGNLYGLASGGANGEGMVFRLTSTGELSTLFDFTPTVTGATGGMVIAGDGNLYGITSSGGSAQVGSVFRLTPAGVYTTMASFSASTGQYPAYGLTLGKDSKLYGVCTQGGVNNAGTIFKMTLAGDLSTVASFSAAVGKTPMCRLSCDADGNLFGVTSSGGANGLGSIYACTPLGELSALYHFSDTSGYNGSVTAGADGNLYGLIYYGNGGKGSAFKLTQGGSFTRIHSFDDGGNTFPYGDLVQAADGNFYGISSQGPNQVPFGIFRMSPAGEVTPVKSLGSSYGSSTSSSLTAGVDGNVYGATSAGGVDTAGLAAGGGQIFRLKFGLVPLTQGATQVGSSSASLNGYVDPQGATMDLSFQYGTTSSLAVSSAVPAGSLAAGASAAAFQAPLNGLSPNTTYYFRIVATKPGNAPETGRIYLFTTRSSPSPLEAWRSTYFNDPSSTGPGAPLANADGDALNNLQEYAFGTHPGQSQGTQASAVSWQSIAPGSPGMSVVLGTRDYGPVVVTTYDGKGIFARRKDRLESGLIYHPQFSNDLVHWTESTEVPTVLGADSQMEVVSVPLLAPAASLYFRVGVEMP